MSKISSIKDVGLSGSKHEKYGDRPWFLLYRNKFWYIKNMQWNTIKNIETLLSNDLNRRNLSESIS